MSETKTPADKPTPTPLPRWSYISTLFLNIVPANAIYLSLFGPSHPTHDERLWSAFSWGAVLISTLLATYSVYRVRINMNFHRRPFTPKDAVYLRAAAASAVGMAIILLGASYAWGPRLPKHAIGVGDVVAAQMACLLVISSLLFLLVEVHQRGAKLFEELESGV